MKYLFLGLIVFGLASCGSSSSKSNNTLDKTKPKPPATKDITKQPPSIPDI